MAAPQPPIVDRLDTRALERREAIRTVVMSAEIVEAAADHAVLRTSTWVNDLHTVHPDNARGLGGAPAMSGRPAGGEMIQGTLRLDLLASGAFRVRYAEGQEVPANDTPMVTGSLDPVAVEFSETDEGLCYQLAEHRVDVQLNPMVIRVSAGQGSVVCEVGGGEKNDWNMWDAFNTGVHRTTPDNHPLATESFALRSGEAIYGFGETFMGLDKTGQTIDLNMVEPLGVSTPRSYKNIPFFVTSHGYGVYFNHSSRITAWVGSMSAVDVQIAIEDDFLD